MLELSSILKHWGLSEGAQLRRDFPVPGSPERCLERCVFEIPKNGRLYLAERIPEKKLSDRLRQARILERLRTLPEISPWLKAADGTFFLPEADSFWQVRAFVPERAPLPREEYGNDGWRGAEAARVLRSLSYEARNLPQIEQGRFFSLEHYTRHHLVPQIQQGNPALYRDLQPILEELEPFFQQEHALPRQFAHGDFHPGNILWDYSRISGVIDWEFCGVKVALYDVANMLGCLGMDRPEWLTGKMASAFLNELRVAWDFSNDVWDTLPLLTAALRLGWLREWFVRQDREMMCQELDFIWLLLDNRNLLQKRWNFR